MTAGAFAALGRARKRRASETRWGWDARGRGRVGVLGRGRRGGGGGRWALGKIVEALHALGSDAVKFDALEVERDTVERAKRRLLRVHRHSCADLFSLRPRLVSHDEPVRP